MEYGAIVGFLSRINATLQGDRIMVGDCQIGTLTKDRLSNMEDIGAACADVQTLGASPYGNDVAVHAKDGMFTLKGLPGEVYTIHDEVDDPILYPTTPVETVLWMRRLYPTIDEDLFYEELTHLDYVNMAMFGEEPGFADIGEKFEDTFHADFQTRLNMAGVTKGQMVSKERFRSALNVLTDPQTGHGRNLFLEWLKSLEWDGVPRVRNWFKWGIGASVPVLGDVSPEYEDKYLGDVSEAWFVGAVRKQYREIKHEIVPVLVGDQGIGKSSFVKAMSFDPKWFSETSIDVSDPVKFLESVPGSVIVELSEGTQFTPQSAATLKGFVSKTSDVYRLPYAKRPGRFMRHFSMISTSNNQKLFYDVTGNRRFYPMVCNTENAHFIPFKDYDPDERTYGFDIIEQLWAEAYQMEQAGHKHMVPMETKGLAEIVQDAFMVDDAGLNTINEFLDDPINGYSQPGAIICKQMVMDYAWALQDVSEKSKEEAWKNWVNSQKDWSSKTGSVRIGSYSSRKSYIRKYAPQERFRNILAKAIEGLKVDDTEKVAVPLPPIPKRKEPVEEVVEPEPESEPEPEPRHVGPTASMPLPPTPTVAPDPEPVISYKGGYSMDMDGVCSLPLNVALGYVNWFASCYGIEDGGSFDPTKMPVNMQDILKEHGLMMENNGYACLFLSK